MNGRQVTGAVRRSLLAFSQKFVVEDSNPFAAAISLAQPVIHAVLDDARHGCTSGQRPANKEG
jgi:hypothetical protein